MKKYIFPQRTSSAFILDTETLEIKPQDSFYSFIDYTYIAEEDGIYTLNGKDKEIKKGDFILKMYTPNRTGEQPIFIVKDQELIDYAKDYVRIREEEDSRHSLKINGSSDCETANCIG